MALIDDQAGDASEVACRVEKRHRVETDAADDLVLHDRHDDRVRRTRKQRFDLREDQRRRSVVAELAQQCGNGCVIGRLRVPDREVRRRDQVRRSRGKNVRRCRALSLRVSASPTAAQGRRLGQAPTLTVEMHSGSSPFQSEISTPRRVPRSIGHSPSPSKYTVLRVLSGMRYPHLGERLGRFRDRTRFRNSRHFGSRPRQDIHTSANPPADSAIATTSKYTTLRDSSNAEYPHRCERRGHPVNHPHRRNAQRFESIPGKISTPSRTPRSMPHSLSKFSTLRVPTKAGYSHLSGSPSRSRDRNHLEIHDASHLFKRRISTPLQAPRPPRRSPSPSKCTALRVHSRARYPHLGERLVQPGARIAPRHPQHAESLAGTGYYIETGAPFTSMVDIHL